MNDDPKRPWTQNRRFEFIEWKLFWEGQLNRSDLETQFEISTPQASVDLKRYREMAGDNIAYDATEKAFVPTRRLVPQFLAPSADRLLLQLRALLSAALPRREVWFKSLPAIDMAPDLVRHVDPDCLRVILQAIRTRSATACSCRIVTVGLVAWSADWPLAGLMVLLSAAAILGDSVGYWIGAKSGPKLFSKEKSFFFRKDHLVAAQAFYEKHGGKTIIIARFMPFIRTFAPVVAGIGKMEYRRFLMFNIVGGVAWIVSMLTLGYILRPVLDKPLKSIFGEDFETAKHVEKVILLVVFISIAPGIYAAVKGWLQKRKTVEKAEAVSQ